MTLWRFAFWCVLPVDVCGCHSAHLLSSSSSTSSSSTYDLRFMFWSPRPPSLLVFDVTIAPHSGLERWHRGPQCPLWNHRAPSVALHQNCYPVPHHCPPDLSHTLVFPASDLLYSQYLRGWREGGECVVVTIIVLLHWPPAPKPLRMPCVYVMCVHHPQKRKRGLDGL